MSIPYTLFIIGVKENFGTESRYNGTINHAVYAFTTTFLSRRCLFKTIDCFASRTPLFLVYTSREAGETTSFLLFVRVIVLRLTLTEYGLYRGERQRESEVRCDVMLKSFSIMPVRHYYSVQHPSFYHCHGRCENKTTST